MAKKIYSLYNEFFKTLKSVSNGKPFKKLSVLSLRYGITSNIFDVLVGQGIIAVRHDKRYTYIDWLYDKEITEEVIAEIHQLTTAAGRAGLPNATLSSVKSLRGLEDRGWEHMRRGKKSVAVPPSKVVTMNGNKYRVPIYNDTIVLTVGDKRIEIEV